MSKKNNDALEQEKEDAQVIENDDETIDNDDSASADNTTDNDTSISADETTDNDASTDEENPSGSPKILIAEIIIAVAAIGFIIFALISNNKGQGSVSDNTTASGNISTNDYGYTVPDTGITAFDNSILYENIPAIPDIAEFNNMTEEEAKAAVEDNTMLVYTLADGASLYIGNYTNQEYFISEASVSDNEIDEYISEVIRQYFGEVTETDHTVVSEYDVVNANYVGKLDGVAFDRGSAENEEIIVGAGGYIPGFEEGFIGMAVGETKDVPITFPEDYGNTELAGKDVVFTFTVNEIIGTMVYPEELTDEMVPTIPYNDSCTTVAEYRDRLKELMTENKVWNFVTENYYITSIPEDTVYYYYNEEMASQEQTAAQYQMAVADLIFYYGMTIDDLKQDVITNACYTAILTSICDTIAAENGLSVSDEDIAAFVDEFAATYGYDTTTLLSMIDEETVKEYLIQEKILDYLISLLP